MRRHRQPITDAVAGRRRALDAIEFHRIVRHLETPMITTTTTDDDGRPNAVTGRSAIAAGSALTYYGHLPPVSLHIHCGGAINLMPAPHTEIETIVAWAREFANPITIIKSSRTLEIGTTVILASQKLNLFTVLPTRASDELEKTLVEKTLDFTPMASGVEVSVTVERLLATLCPCTPDAPEHEHGVGGYAIDWNFDPPLAVAPPAPAGLSVEEAVDEMRAQLTSPATSADATIDAMADTTAGTTGASTTCHD